MLETIRDYWAKAEGLEPNYKNLKALHTLFVHEVVFSSLSINLGIKPFFDPALAFKKVVIEQEGDACLLINFAAKYLLEKIGYKRVECINSEVFHVHKNPVSRGTAIHMTMIVTLEDEQGEEVKYVFDPGFSNSHRAPLPFTGEIIHDVMSDYRVVFDESEGRYAVQEKCDGWKTQFIFDPSDVMDQKAFGECVNFAYQDAHYFRNNLYIQKCSYNSCLQILNDQFLILFANGTVEKRSILDVGGLRSLLIKEFGLPEKYVDSVKLKSDSMLTPVSEMLSRLWEPTLIPQ